MKKIPPELAAKIDEIHSWMFDGDLDRVAKLSRKSKVWVCRILNKRVSPHKDVIEAGLQVMMENKARFQCLD